VEYQRGLKKAETRRSVRGGFGGRARKSGKIKRSTRAGGEEKLGHGRGMGLGSSGRAEEKKRPDSRHKLMSV